VRTILAAPQNNALSGGVQLTGAHKMRVIARRLLQGVAACLFLAASCARVFYLTDRDGWNKRKYDLIQVGMTRVEAREALGDSPDCVIPLGRAEAWFFRGAFGSVECHGPVSSVAELPSVYGALQILIGPDGRVRAVAMRREAAEERVRRPTAEPQAGAGG
jgi:hypothetical protein